MDRLGRLVRSGARPVAAAIFGASLPFLASIADAQPTVTRPGPDAIHQVEGRVCRLRAVKKVHTYKKVGDHEIRANVFRAPGDDVRPVLIWIHGGALIGGSRNDLPPAQLKRFIDAGYVVVAIDYRLAPETKLPSIIEDLRDAYTWVKSEGPSAFKIDPARIGVVGHSAGGYLTLMSGHLGPKALVSFYGYGSLTSDFYEEPSAYYRRMGIISERAAKRAVGTKTISSAEGDAGDSRYDFYFYLRQRGLWPTVVSGGHDPRREEAWFQPFEPLKNVTAGYPPTLFLHGGADDDVPLEQSVLMAKELERNGVNAELLTNPKWKHGFDDEEEDPSVAKAFERVIEFLNEKLTNTSPSC